ENVVDLAVEVQDSRFQVDPWVKMGNSEIMVEDVETQSEIEYMRICPDIGDSAGACGCPHTRRLGSNGPCELCEGEPMQEKFGVLTRCDSDPPMHFQTTRSFTLLSPFYSLRSRTQRFQVDAWVKMGNSEIMVKDVDTQVRLTTDKVTYEMRKSSNQKAMEKAHSFLETYIHVGSEAILPTAADLAHYS
ncbi:hypothetical protein Tco_0838234, partial [Tanacetum coccineum]